VYKSCVLTTYNKDVVVDDEDDDDDDDAGESREQASTFLSEDWMILNVPRSRVLSR